MTRNGFLRDICGELEVVAETVAGSERNVLTVEEFAGQSDSLCRRRVVNFDAGEVGCFEAALDARDCRENRGIRLLGVGNGLRVFLTPTCRRLAFDGCGVLADSPRQSGVRVDSGVRDGAVECKRIIVARERDIRCIERALFQGDNAVAERGGDCAGAVVEVVAVWRESACQTLERRVGLNVGFFVISDFGAVVLVIFGLNLLVGCDRLINRPFVVGGRFRVAVVEFELVTGGTAYRDIFAVEQAFGNLDAVAAV